MGRTKLLLAVVACVLAIVVARIGVPQDLGGDLNADGVDDEVVAEPEGESPFSIPGVVYVTSGSDGDLVVKLQDQADGDLFGYSSHSTTDLEESDHGG